MATKMGRPLSDNPKKHKVLIRLTDEENSVLEECCKSTGKTKSDIFREGFRLLATKILEEK